MWPLSWKADIYYLAQALLHTVFGEKSHEGTVTKTMLGSEMCGMEYEQLYRFDGVTYPREKGWYVVSDDYVTLTDGTGIVHTAPAFGEDDARVGRDNNLPFVQLVNTQGKFIEGTPWANESTKEVNEKVLENLKARGLLFAAEPFTHNYPFCWRCDTALLYYARSTWFIRMTALHDQLMANNRTVNWLPENIKEGRFGNFLDKRGGLGPEPRAVLGHAAAHLGLRGWAHPRDREQTGASRYGDCARCGGYRAAPPLHRRGGDHLPHLRQSDAPCERSDRLLVR